MYLDWNFVFLSKRTVEDESYKATISFDLHGPCRYHSLMYLDWNFISLSKRTVEDESYKATISFDLHGLCKYPSLMYLSLPQFPTEKKEQF
jgi:hypothetical protein